MEEKIKKKLEEMEFKESETKPGLWGKPDGGDYLNWDFRKGERGGFYVVLSDDTFEKTMVSKNRPEYIALRQIQDPNFKPETAQVAGSGGKINIVIKDNLNVESLKRFKDDVREVKTGMECGVKVAGFDDLKVDDVLEFYEIVKVARTL